MHLEARPDRLALPDTTLDQLLTAQIAVAWAGEGGEEPRLGWWRTFLVHEDGGLALFADLTPRTHRWAALQAVREAARRADAAARGGERDADRLFTLYRFGFEIDERLDERLLDLKRSGRDPAAALPGLGAVITDRWRPEAFQTWAEGQAEVSVQVSPSGRRLTGAPPADLERRARALVAALAPLGRSYPMPHYKVG